MQWLSVLFCVLIYNPTFEVFLPTWNLDLFAAARLIVTHQRKLRYKGRTITFLTRGWNVVEQNHVRGGIGKKLNVCFCFCNIVITYCPPKNHAQPPTKKLPAHSPPSKKLWFIPKCLKLVYFGKVLRYNYLYTSSNFLFGFTLSVVLTSTRVDVFEKTGTGGGELGWEFCKGIVGEAWLVDGDDFFLKLNEICSYDILNIWWPLKCHAIFRDG